MHEISSFFFKFIVARNALNLTAFDIIIVFFFFFFLFLVWFFFVCNGSNNNVIFRSAPVENDYKHELFQIHTFYYIIF